MKPFFPFACYLLVYCLEEGASPTADGAGGRGAVATLIAGSAHPNPWQKYGCNLHQGGLAKLSLALENARKSAKRVADLHRSHRKLEKARKPVLTEIPSRRFPFGNLKKFRLHRSKAVDHYRGVDRDSESKLKPLTAVWSSTIAVHGTIEVFWTT